MLNFQEVILTLQRYWGDRGCAILQPYDMEVGAGTSHTATFLRAIGPEPWRAAYVQPSRRPKDGRYGENPNRMQHYYQFQVVLKPSPLDIIDLYLDSLRALGIDPQTHDIRFVEDDWENPTLGAWGLGWEVWLDGMEVTQFTYFQQVGGLDCKPITGEITYGIERLAMYLQGVENVFDLVWAPGLTYRDVYHQNEVEQSAYNFELSNASMLFQHFTDYEQEAKRLIAGQLALPAYEMVLKGRFYLRKQEVDSQNKALEYYKQAVEIDPNYALANAELAATYIVLYGSSFLDPKEFRPKAEAATYKALELDDNLAEAHYALAALKQNNWEWASAEREILRALELNPNLADGYRFYSYYLMVRGRFEESVDAAKRAHELDPLSLAASAHIVNCLNVARHYDEAIELSRKILELDHNFAPAHYSLAGAYEGKGLYLDAIYERQESIKFGGDSPSDQIYLGAVYAKAGDLKTAHQILKRLETSKDYVSPGELAVLYTSLGERDQAFASLEKAYAAHDLQLQFLGADSSFDSLREDPRFKDLMHRIGLT